MKNFDEFQSHLQEQKQIEENAVRYEALDAMKQIQATISSVSLLNVLGVMKPDNPLRANVLDMEAQLHDLNANLGQFIADNIADVETEGEEAAGEEPEEEVEPEEEKPEKKEKPAKKEKKEEKKPAKKKKEEDEPDEPEVKGDAPKEQEEEKE